MPSIKSTSASSYKKGSNAGKEIKKATSSSLRKGDVIVKKQPSKKKTIPKKEDVSQKYKSTQKEAVKCKQQISPSGILTDTDIHIVGKGKEKGINKEKEKKEEATLVPVEDPEQVRLRHVAEAIKREQERVEVAASIVLGAAAVAPSRLPAPSVKDKRAALKLAQVTHIRASHVHLTCVHCKSLVL